MSDGAEKPNVSRESRKGWPTQGNPDETEGRQLYRDRAEALARGQLAYGRRHVKVRT